MTDPIVFVDTSEIREGKPEELRRAVAELAEFVEANETETISYQVFFSDGDRQMTVLQVHPDSASMERHMEVAGPVFGKFADLLVLRTTSTARPARGWWSNSSRRRSCSGRQR